MKTDTWSDILDRVQRVDPPPFLFTRVEARLEAGTTERPSRAWVTALALAMVFLLVVNTWLLTGGERNADGMEQVTASMGMSTSNQLYHE